ncbi:MAG: class I SAM-dependent methyltransferase [Halioglobus sp.]
MHSYYYDKNYVLRNIAEGKHREVIGGLWEELGKLQLDWLVGRDMQPNDFLLDIGCGSLRLGTLAVNYLAPGHYSGTDINLELMEAGYEREISEKSRMPPENLLYDSDFGFRGVTEKTTYAIATSVFTHLPFNHLRRALLNMKHQFPLLKEFCFSIFLAPSGESMMSPVEQAGGVWTHDIKDPYHYLPSDINYVCELAGFDSHIHDWGHPRNQMMVVATPR